MKKIAFTIFIITGGLVIYSFIIGSSLLLVSAIIGGVTLGGFLWEASKPFKNIPLGTPSQQLSRFIHKNFN